MKWNEIPAGRINAAQQRLLVAMGDDADNITTRMIDDADFVSRLVKYAQNGAFEPSTSQKRAREIMSTNFFGVEEAIKHFGVTPTKRQLACFAEIPFSEEVLTDCKDTHILVAIFPLSILDIRVRVSKMKLPSGQKQFFYPQDWYGDHAFTYEGCKIGWQLIQKTPVAQSTSKTWSEQQALLGKNEETPTAQTLVYVIMGHFLATGTCLFERVCVRSSTLDSHNDRVRVGYFDTNGFCLNLWSDNNPNLSIGVSSARKQ